MHDVDTLYWDMPQLSNVPCAHPVFAKSALPGQIARRLKRFPEGPLRDWTIKRARQLCQGDADLWAGIISANPDVAEFRNASVASELDVRNGLAGFGKVAENG